MHQTEIAHHRENRQWAFLLGRSLVAVTLGLVLALGLIGARARVAVFVFLYFGVLDRILLSLSSVFGCVLLDLGSVFSRILVLSLCRTRCHQACKSNTEDAISNESIKSHLSLLFRASHYWLTSTVDKNTESWNEVADTGL
jgi:hypothetical protein